MTVDGSYFLVWLLLITGSDIVYGQYDHCLKPVGCHQDECCFNIVSKTGPVCDLIPGCAAQFKPDCCRNSRPVHTDYGIMYGYAILLDDNYGYRDNGRRYLQIWRGVPYARPPTRENNLRFRRPVPPVNSKAKYDATYFRSACAQPDAGWDAPFSIWSKEAYEWMKRLPIRQVKQEASKISEDCLYMNIYTLNETDTFSSSSNPDQQKRLPIVVIFQGLDHLTGTANRFQGHALAQLGLVVITVNYRLGPFGFLSTVSSNRNSSNWKDFQTDDSDDRANGNYGLWDQIRALEFIREHAEKFLGDPNRITVLGYGSAAGDVALHLLSKHSGRRKPALFHQAILMSGSDRIEGGFIRHPDESEAYAKQLAFQVGCSSATWKTILSCLHSRTAVELATAAGQTRIHRPQWLTKPWSPTLDGDFIEDIPEQLWKDGKYAHIPLIGGMTTDNGAFYAVTSLLQSKNISNFNIVSKQFDTSSSILPDPNPDYVGLTEQQMLQGFLEMTQKDFAQDPVALSQTLKFEYTYWPNAEDNMERWSEYISAFTDRYIGSGLIETLRFHSTFRNYSTNLFPFLFRPEPLNLTQMYIFAYKSENDPWTRVLGVYPGTDLTYLFGYPRLQLYKTWDEIMNEWPVDLGLEAPHYQYTSLDLNLTDYMLSFLSNFAKSGNVTPVAIRNLTWDTYRPDNRTYLWINLTSNYSNSQSHRYDLEQLGIGAGFDLRQNFKVYKHSYWSRLYPIQLTWVPRFTPPTPTPPDTEVYRNTAVVLAGLLTIVCLLLIALLILYIRKRKVLMS